MDELENARQYVSGLVRGTITQTSARDAQRSVGPSELGNPCDHCVAQGFLRKSRLAARQTEQGFSLKGWFGTAAHEKLERELLLPEHIGIREERVFIHHIDGYGDIHGNIDLQLPEIVVDYKTTDMTKLKDIKLNGVPESHCRQTMLYGHGVRKAGREVKYIALVYIPRDNNNVNEIYCTVAEYSQDIADDTLRRAESIWSKIQEGQTEFDSHPKCWPCNQFSMGYFGY